MYIPEFLAADPLQYAGILEPLRMGTARLIRADERGALAWIEEARLHLLAARDAQTARELLALAENPVFLMLCDPEHISRAQDLPFRHRMTCLQALYLKNEPPVANKRLRIAPPDERRLQCIIENYTMDSPEELKRRARRGELFFAEDGMGKRVGFVGLHPEGCFGVLQVFPEMRGQGFGAALEAFIIRFCMENGRLPYCQVDVNNLASLNLQKKMGLELSSKPMLMLWNDF